MPCGLPTVTPELRPQWPGSETEHPQPCQVPSRGLGGQTPVQGHETLGIWGHWPKTGSKGRLAQGAPLTCGARAMRL